MFYCKHFQRFPLNFCLVSMRYRLDFAFITKKEPIQLAESSCSRGRFPLDITKNLLLTLRIMCSQPRKREHIIYSVWQVACSTFSTHCLLKLIRDLSANSSNVAFEVLLASKRWWQSGLISLKDSQLRILPFTNLKIRARIWHVWQWIIMASVIQLGES